MKKGLEHAVGAEMISFRWMRKERHVRGVVRRLGTKKRAGRPGTRDVRNLGPRAHLGNGREHQDQERMVVFNAKETSHCWNA